MSKLNSFISSDLLARFVKFGLIGILTTIFGIGVYVVLLKILHLNVYVSYPIQFVIAVTFSFLLNSYLNYKTQPNLKGWIIFIQSYAISGVAGFGLLVLLKQILTSWDDLAIVILLALIKAVFTFFIIERLMFKKKKPEN